MLGTFGNFAPGGLLVNMLLVPLSFWILCALLLSCAFGLCGLLWPASLFNHSAWLLLAFMLWCAELTLSSPIGFYSGLAWNWDGYGTAACVLLIAGSFLSNHHWFTARKSLQLWFIPALWVFLLLLGLLPIR